jgi:prephenate dehydratase
MSKVAFYGERGAFTEDAALKFDSSAEFLSCQYVSDGFDAVLNNTADFAVVPVENSQAGSINETYDLLLRHPVTIYGEIILRVSHFLMALPGENLSSITTVFSHPQAIAQSEVFLGSLNVDIIPGYNTAGSAKKIKEERLKGYAAVANHRAAEIYGLEILAEHIETNPNNFTRFFVISKQLAERAQQNKTSLVFSTKNVPGALHTILGAFAKKNINLTKLESRPSREKPWEYVFYLDFEGHKDDELCKEAIGELEQMTNFFKILGSYPRATD